MLSEEDEQLMEAALSAVTFKRAGGIFALPNAQLIIGSSASYLVRNLFDDFKEGIYIAGKSFDPIKAVPGLPFLHIRDEQTYQIFRLLMGGSFSRGYPLIDDFTTDVWSSYSWEGAYTELFHRTGYVLSFRDEVIGDKEPPSDDEAIRLIAQLSMLYGIARSLEKPVEEAEAFFDIEKLHRKRKEVCRLLGITNAPGVWIKEKDLARLYSKTSPASVSDYFTKYGNVFLWQSLGRFLDDNLSKPEYRQIGLMGVSIHTEEYVLNQHRHPVSLKDWPHPSPLLISLIDAFLAEYGRLITKGKKSRRVFKSVEDFKDKFPQIIITYTDLKNDFKNNPMW